MDSLVSFSVARKDFGTHSILDRRALSNVSMYITTVAQIFGISFVVPCHFIILSNSIVSLRRLRFTTHSCSSLIHVHE